MRIPQGAIRSEWERIRAHDILYLLSLKPTLRRGENVPAELAAAPFWYERERVRLPYPRSMSTVADWVQSLVASDTVSSMREDSK